MKKIGIIGIEGGWSTEKLVDAVRSKQVDSYLINMDKVYFDSEKGKIFYNDMDLTEFDAIIIKKIGLEYNPDHLNKLELLRYLDEKSGIKVFSKPFQILKLINRLSCTMTMQIGGIPMPPTAITGDEEIALSFVRNYKKAVFKPLYGTKAKFMKVIMDNESAMQEILDFKKFSNSLMYIQKVINIKEKDYGLVFIGGKYLSAYARLKSANSWNTTTESGGKYIPHEPSYEMIKLAEKAQSLFNLDFTCVDIALTEEGIFVFEVSAFGGFRGLMEANGIDAAELYIDYVLERI